MCEHFFELCSFHLPPSPSASWLLLLSLFSYGSSLYVIYGAVWDCHLLSSATAYAYFRTLQHLFFFFDNVKKARSFTHCYILNKPSVWLIQKTTYALSSKSDAWSGCPCSSRGWTRRGTEVPSNPNTSVICDWFAAMWTSSRSTYMPDYSPHFAEV